MTTPTPQFFKGDAEELKFFGVAEPTQSMVSADLTTFFDEAFGCFLLGELLWDNKTYAPLSTAIPRNVFRQVFGDLFAAFEVSGTFESYLSVFKKVFGIDAEVTFTVPGPGKLEIDIVASGVDLSLFLADPSDDTVVDDAGNYIVFDSVKGFQSQYELEQCLFEMVPDGISIVVTLSLADFLTSETGDRLITESGDFLIGE